MLTPGRVVPEPEFNGAQWWRPASEIPLAGARTCKMVLDATGRRKNMHKGTGRDLHSKGARTCTMVLDVTATPRRRW